MQEKYDAEINKRDEQLRRQEEIFEKVLNDIKAEYQERIVFLQTMLAPTVHKDKAAVHSRYFVDFERFWKRFKGNVINSARASRENEVIDRKLLLDFDDQLQECDEVELRQMKMYAGHQEFWEFYAKYRVPQFAAYACRVLFYNNVGQKRQTHIFSTLEKYSDVYKKRGMIFNELAVQQAYKQVGENPEIFVNLKQTSTIEYTAKVIKTVGNIISGIKGVTFKTGRKGPAKEIVEYDDIVKHIMIVMKQGYNAKGIDIYSTRLFGFFLGLCLVTGQRNKTVREVKFKDFSEKPKGKFYVEMFATKTQKASKYEIAEGIYK